MEEKKEKKTIKCSYAVLVIILFAALAFVTDYAYIERKTRKCDCPKCEATNNEVISDNTGFNENYVYTYEKIAAFYSGYPLNMDDTKEVAGLTLYQDGTYSYGEAPGIKSIGNYIIIGDEIRLNDILSVGSDPQMRVLYSSKIFKIDENGSFIYYDANIKPGLSGYPDEVKDIRFVRNKELEEGKNSFDNAMENLNRYYIERNY